MKKQSMHLKAPDNWINDPNGFIYFKGMYHLFYQYFPYEPRWGTMHWGHAVSKDLVHWEHKGIALRPSVYEDSNGCFSGSAVEADGKLYVAYTGVRYEVVNPLDPHTCVNDQLEAAQLMTVSEDGFSFDHENGKWVIIPPLKDPEIGDRTHARDPKIWKGTDAWYMILGSMTAGRQGEVLFYRSEDLHHWSYVNKAFKKQGYGWMWECPDLFETDGGAVLIVSPMGLVKEEGQEPNQPVCFPVSFDESTCSLDIPDMYQFFDYGLDLYAPQSTLDEQGRRVVVAWLRMPQVTGEGWIGMFCAPRVVERRGNHICFRMHPNIRKAYSKEVNNLPENAAGWRAVFELNDGEQIDFGGFIIRKEKGRVWTDRTAVYPADAPRARCKAHTPIVREGNLVEVLADDHLVEVYVNDGEYVISCAVYGLGRTVSCSVEKAVKLYADESQNKSM